jgi:hypothetical protein
MYGVVLLLLARVNACLVLEWYCDEATGVQKRAQAAAVQQRKDLGPRTWKSTADSSSLLTSIIHSPSQRLTYSLTTRASVRRHGCCCLVTIAISLCNTRNSAAWTIAIHHSIKQTLLDSIKPTAVYQYRCHQHRPTSAHQHRHRHPFQYRYRAIRRSLAPLNPVHPFDFLETPPRASTRYDPSLSLLLPLHIAACPPIVCLPSYCCRCCHHQISITTTAASNCHH